MNIELKIKREILFWMLSSADAVKVPVNTPEDINKAWTMAYDYEGVFSDYEIIDEVEEFRESGKETNLPVDGFSRHYECSRVARRLGCGPYVSWLYWSGGGKHGEPEAIDWIESAIEVECKEEEKLVTVRTYSIPEKEA